MHDALSCSFSAAGARVGTLAFCSGDVVRMDSIDLDAVQRAINDLQQQKQRMVEERAALEASKRFVNDSLDRFKHHVKLNVGGNKFETTLTTLTRYPDSMLGTMFSGREGINVKACDDGYVFIDRDGSYFGFVLNFLRDGEIELPHDAVGKRLVWRELKYYMLDDAARSSMYAAAPKWLKILRSCSKDGIYEKSKLVNGRPSYVDRKQGKFMFFFSTRSMWLICDKLSHVDENSGEANEGYGYMQLSSDVMCLARGKHTCLINIHGDLYEEEVHVVASDQK